MSPGRCLNANKHVDKKLSGTVASCTEADQGAVVASVSSKEVTFQLRCAALGEGPRRRPRHSTKAGGQGAAGAGFIEPLGLEEGLRVLIKVPGSEPLCEHPPGLAEEKTAVPRSQGGLGPPLPQLPLPAPFTSPSLRLPEQKPGQLADVGGLQALPTSFSEKETKGPLIKSQARHLKCHMEPAGAAGAAV